VSWRETARRLDSLLATSDVRGLGAQDCTNTSSLVLSQSKRSCFLMPFLLRQVNLLLLSELRLLLVLLLLPYYRYYR
jgi:hypothetical protein